MAFRVLSRSIFRLRKGESHNIGNIGWLFDQNRGKKEPTEREFELVEVHLLGSSGKLVLFRIKPLRGDTDLNDAKDFHGFELLFFAWLSMDSIVKKDRLYRSKPKSY